MSHFLTFPTNENGLILDETFRNELLMLTSAPFAFGEFFIYSHGWWTDATRAMSEYNRFSVEFSKVIHEKLGGPGAPILAAGIHWPSMLSDDTRSIENYLEALSFYTMEKRANSIGEHGGYTVLRTIFDQLDPTAKPFRVNLIGHSFGCKVVCSTLEEIAKEGRIPAAAQVNVVLLQGAMDNDSMDAGNCYSDVPAEFKNIRFLITKSSEDAALQHAYPTAHRLANLFKTAIPPALGAAGPNAYWANLFPKSANVSVDVGFNSDPNQMRSTLVVADLSPLHKNRANTYKADKFTGHHSDIFQPEVYELIRGFLS